jgi:hypothetical protein
LRDNLLICEIPVEVLIEDDERDEKAEIKVVEVPVEIIVEKDVCDQEVQTVV